MSKVSLIQRFEVSPSASVTIAFYQVSPAKILHIKEISVDFPVGTANQLQVQFFRNEIPILPSDPTKKIVGENISIKFTEVPDLFSYDTLVVALQNLSSTETKACIIKLEGEEE